MSRIRICAGPLFIWRENRHALAGMIGAECPGRFDNRRRYRDELFGCPDGIRDFERGSPRECDTGSPVVHG
jgi:hypothetical protein